MNHQHFSEIDSTQDYLKDNFDKLQKVDSDILISTDKQTKGKGRLGNSWSQLENSLAFSFSLKPNEEITLSSLEIGVLVADFMKQDLDIDIKLKWPNDLLNSNGEKCGGILCNLKDNNKLIVGVGINLGNHSPKSHPSEKTKFPIGFLKADIILDLNKQKDIPAKIYKTILNNRLGPEAVINKWNSYNFHKDKEVLIKDTNSSVQGKFVGINKIGAALIEDQSGTTHTLVSGSLWNV